MLQPAVVWSPLKREGEGGREGERGREREGGGGREGGRQFLPFSAEKKQKTYLTSSLTG